jgi:predicted nucleotidyltransferase
MRKPLKIKLADIRQEQLKELMQTLEQVFADCGVDFYLLGALARDAWYAREQIRSRATRDVDVAVYVPGEKQFNVVIEQLTEDHGFRKAQGDLYRLYTPFGFPVDLIPFGEISIDDKLQPAIGSEKPVFINGFREIYELATVQVQTDEHNLQFRVATLPAIILLKLISYDDRPEKRSQDPLDIAEIIENYFEIEKELIWEHHSDLFDDDSELTDISAVVIGRQLKQITIHNLKLKERICTIVSL